MTDAQEFVVEVLKGAPGGISALLGIYCAWRIAQVRTVTNGMKDDLVKKTHDAAFARGHEEGATQNASN